MVAEMALLPLGEGVVGESPKWSRFPHKAVKTAPKRPILSAVGDVQDPVEDVEGGDRQMQQCRLA